MAAAGTGLAGELGIKRRDDPALYAREYRRKNAEKIRAYARAYHAKMKNDPAYNAMKCRSGKFARRKKKYGITQDEYEKRLTQQKGLCDICKQHFGEDLRVDHNHETGKVRALLCANCNSGIGLLGEDPDRLNAAVEYLRRHQTGAKWLNVLEI